MSDIQQFMSGLREVGEQRQGIRHADAQAHSPAPAGYALEIKLKGETPEQLWGSLLGLVCYACECKQAQGGHWPHMVSTTDDGKITVRHNSAHKRWRT